MAKKTIEIDPAVIEKKSEMDSIIEKVKELDNEIAVITELYRYEQETLKYRYENKKKKLNDNRELLLCNLKTLFNEVPHKETKTQIKVELLNGDVVVKKATAKLDYDKTKLLEWAKANGMNELISTKEVEDFKWSEYKARLVITEGGIIDTETGELVEVEGLTIKEVAEEIQVKY